MGAEEGNRGFASPFADRLPYSVGTLAAAWFVLFSQSSPLLATFGPQPGEAFASYLCAGVAALGVAAGLLCLKDPYRAQPLAKRSPRLCRVLAVGGAVLVGAGAAAGLLGSAAGPFAEVAAGVGAGFAAETAGAGLAAEAAAGAAPAFAVGGFAAGVGFAMVALVAFDQVARRSVRGSAALVGAACAVFALLHGVLWLCQGLASLPALLLLLALAAFLVVAPQAARDVATSPESAPATQTTAARPAATAAPSQLQPIAASPSASLAPERGEGEPTTVPQRLSSIARSCWGLYAVLLISMFLLGFNWDPVRLGLYPIRPALLTLEESLGALAAALLLFALCRRSPNVDALAFLQWTVVPAVVATFIVVPYFPLESTGGFFYEFVGFVRCASIFLFAGGFVVAQSAVCRAADASVPFVAGLAFALCGACLDAGFVLSRVLGATIDMLVVLLFVGCLVAMVVARSVSRGDVQKVRRIEREVFDAYLQQRCAAIAAAHGLSPRESEILLYLSRGHGYVYIAELAFVSEGTVRTHAKSIFRKCGVSSREELLDLIDERP